MQYISTRVTKEAYFDKANFLKKGDVVTCEVEGIGELRNQIV